MPYHKGNSPPPMAFTQDDLVSMFGQSAVDTFLSLFPASRLSEMPEAYCGQYETFDAFADDQDFPVDEYDGTYIYQNQHVFYADF